MTAVDPPVDLSTSRQLMHGSTSSSSLQQRSGGSMPGPIHDQDTSAPLSATSTQDWRQQQSSPAFQLDGSEAIDASQGGIRSAGDLQLATPISILPAAQGSNMHHRPNTPSPNSSASSSAAQQPSPLNCNGTSETLVGDLSPPAITRTPSPAQTAAATAASMPPNGNSNSSLPVSTQDHVTITPQHDQHGRSAVPGAFWVVDPASGRVVGTTMHMGSPSVLPQQVLDPQVAAPFEGGPGISGGSGSFFGHFDSKAAVQQGASAVSAPQLQFTPAELQQASPYSSDRNKLTSLAAMSALYMPSSLPRMDLPSSQHVHTQQMHQSASQQPTFKLSAQHQHQPGGPQGQGGVGQTNNFALFRDSSLDSSYYAGSGSGYAGYNSQRSSGEGAQRNSGEQRSSADTTQRSSNEVGSQRRSDETSQRRSDESMQCTSGERSVNYRSSGNASGGEHFSQQQLQQRSHGQQQQQNEFSAGLDPATAGLLLQQGLQAGDLDDMTLLLLAQAAGFVDMNGHLMVPSSTSNTPRVDLGQTMPSAVAGTSGHSKAQHLIGDKAGNVNASLTDLFASTGVQDVYADNPILSSAGGFHFVDLASPQTEQGVHSLDLREQQAHHSLWPQQQLQQQNFSAPQHNLPPMYTRLPTSGNAAGLPPLHRATFSGNATESGDSPQLNQYANLHNRSGGFPGGGGGVGGLQPSIGSGDFATSVGGLSLGRHSLESMGHGNVDPLGRSSFDAFGRLSADFGPGSGSGKRSRRTSIGGGGDSAAQHSGGLGGFPGSTEDSFSSLLEYNVFQGGGGGSRRSVPSSPRLFGSGGVFNSGGAGVLAGLGGAGNSSLLATLGSPSHGRQHSLYKTELCRSWEESGSCRYGNKCQFAHGRQELRPVQRNSKFKSSDLQVCRMFALTGCCPYGARCRFVHAVLPNTPGHVARNSVDLGALGAGSMSREQLLGVAGLAGVREEGMDPIDPSVNSSFDRRNLEISSTPNLSGSRLPTFGNLTLGSQINPFNPVGANGTGASAQRNDGASDPGQLLPGGYNVDSLYNLSSPQLPFFSRLSGSSNSDNLQGVSFSVPPRQQPQSQHHSMGESNEPLPGGFWGGFGAANTAAAGGVDITRSASGNNRWSSPQVMMGADTMHGSGSNSFPASSAAHTTD